MMMIKNLHITKFHFRSSITECEQSENEIFLKISFDHHIHHIITLTQCKIKKKNENQNELREKLILFSLCLKCSIIIDGHVKVEGPLK